MYSVSKQLNCKTYTHIPRGLRIKLTQYTLTHSTLPQNTLRILQHTLQKHSSHFTATPHTPHTLSFALHRHSSHSAHTTIHTSATFPTLHRHSSHSAHTTIHTRATLPTLHKNSHTPHNRLSKVCLSPEHLNDRHLVRAMSRSRFLL